MFQHFGVADALVLLVFVLLILDSRRLHALASGRNRRAVSEPIPVADPDRVGLILRDIQMRRTVDWEDGVPGWEGPPEVLPGDDDVDEWAENPLDLFGDERDTDGEDSVEDDNDEFDEAPVASAAGDVPADATGEIDSDGDEPNQALPVLWTPFPALLLAASSDRPPAGPPCPPVVDREPVTTSTS